MSVVDVAPEHHEEIRAIHAAGGLDYRLPDLESPLLIVKKAVVNERGEVIGACLLRLTAETILLLPPESGPKEKMDVMESLQPEVLRAAWEQGLDEISARIPEETEKIFEKRLRQLGWIKARPWAEWGHFLT